MKREGRGEEGRKERRQKAREEFAVFHSSNESPNTLKYSDSGISESQSIPHTLVYDGGRSEN